MSVPGEFLDLLQFDIKFQRYSAEWAPCDGYDVDLIAWGQFHEKPSPKTVSEILQERHLLLPHISRTRELYLHDLRYDNSEIVQEIGLQKVPALETLELGVSNHASPMSIKHLVNHSFFKGTWRGTLQPWWDSEFKTSTTSGRRSNLTSLTWSSHCTGVT